MDALAVQVYGWSEEAFLIQHGHKKGAALLLALAPLGCRDSTPRAQAPESSVVVTALPPVAPSPSASLQAEAPSRCDLWRDPALVVVRSQAGRGDFFREFRYHPSTAELEVHDSDPFAAGKEQKAPRVVSRSIRLGPEQARLEQALFAICPDAAARKRKCAPGGCLRLEVQGRASTITVEDMGTVQSVMRLLAPSFPELRAQ